MIIILLMVTLLELALAYIRSFMYISHTDMHTYTSTGTVMSKTYGIAKKATAIAVKVLDSEGVGKTR